MALDASKCFRLRNVKLRSSSFTVADDVDDLAFSTIRTVSESRRWTVHKSARKESEALLRSFIHLGMRLRRDSDEPESNPVEGLVIYTIEAVFEVEFVVESTDCPEDEMSKFMENNPAHIAWPFWREHVFSMLRSASLPLVEIPLLAGIKKTSKPETLAAQIGTSP